MCAVAPLRHWARNRASNTAFVAYGKTKIRTLRAGVCLDLFCAPAREYDLEQSSAALGGITFF